MRLGDEWKLIIRQIREICGISQDHLASKLNTGRSYLSKMETGDREAPDWLTERLVNFLVECLSRDNLSQQKREKLLDLLSQLVSLEDEALGCREEEIKRQRTQWKQRKKIVDSMSAHSTAELIEAKPQSIEECLVCLNSYFRRNALRKLLETARLAVRIRPNDAQSHVWLSVAMGRLGQNNGALEAATRAVELDRKNAQAWSTRAIALFFAGKSHETQVCCEMVRRLRSQDSHAFSNVGLAKFFLGKYSESLDCFDQAIEYDPNNPWSRVKKGAVLNHLKRWEDSLNTLEAAMSFDPNNAWVAGERGIALFNMKNYDQALVTLNEAIELGERSAYAYFHRAFVKLFLDTEAGWNAFNEALSFFADGVRQTRFQKQGKIVHNFIHDTSQPLLTNTRGVVRELFSNFKDDPVGLQERVDTLMDVYEKYDVLRVLAKTLTEVYSELMEEAQDEVSARTKPESLQEVIMSRQNRFSPVFQRNGTSNGIYRGRSF